VKAEAGAATVGTSDFPLRYFCQPIFLPLPSQAGRGWDKPVRLQSNQCRSSSIRDKRGPNPCNCFKMNRLQNNRSFGPSNPIQVSPTSFSISTRLSLLRREGGRAGAFFQFVAVSSSQ
jgi:hypothetical protein